jgi:hypothetical protein
VEESGHGLIKVKSRNLVRGGTEEGKSRKTAVRIVGVLAKTVSEYLLSTNKQLYSCISLFASDVSLEIQPAGFSQNVTFLRDYTIPFPT